MDKLIQFQIAWPAFLDVERVLAKVFADREEERRLIEMAAKLQEQEQEASNARTLH